MSANSQHVLQDIDSAYKRVLIYVILINVSMFLLEMIIGFSAQSQALKADALDFFIDSVSYSFSFWALDKCAATRNKIAKIKALSMLILGSWILLMTVYQIFNMTTPNATAMSAVSLLALIANLICVLLLIKYKAGDANIRSVWLCSRNDMINNCLIIIAAGLIFLTQSQWPDLLVAIIMATLFIHSGWHILKQADDRKNANT